MSHALFSTGSKAWRSIACARSELRLDLTLGCGQTFRWRETGEGHWTGVMSGQVWTLTQTDDTLWYHTYGNDASVRKGNAGKRKAGSSLQGSCMSEKRFKEVTKDDEEPITLTKEQDIKDEEMLRDYFQLNVDLGDLYRNWGSADPHFKNISSIFAGVRMLRQDPTECLFSFICTSNNHISRIQGMVERLCHSLGTPLCRLDQTIYHDFPSLDALADSGVEERLREIGFGYRARFLQQSAKQILDQHGTQWLQGLRSEPYVQARDALRTLPGVGTKVADCVCLMSLDKADAVPVDTHVWQIAKRDYQCAAGREQKTITDRVHRDIGDFFRQLWGPYAGWAHSVLFCADLKKFQYLKEKPSFKQDKEEEKTTAKTKIKKEGNGTVNNSKPRRTCDRKAKTRVKKEEA